MHRYLAPPAAAGALLVSLCTSASAASTVGVWEVDIQIDPMTDKSVSASMRSPIVESLEDSLRTQLEISCNRSKLGTSILTLDYGADKVDLEGLDFGLELREKRRRRPSYQSGAYIDNAYLRVRFPGTDQITLRQPTIRLPGTQMTGTARAGIPQFSYLRNNLRSADHMHIRIVYEEFVSRDRTKPRTAPLNRIRTGSGQTTSRIGLDGASEAFEMILRRCATWQG